MQPLLHPPHPRHPPDEATLRARRRAFHALWWILAALVALPVAHAATGDAGPAWLVTAVHTVEGWLRAAWSARG